MSWHCVSLSKSEPNVNSSMVWKSGNICGRFKRSIRFSREVFFFFKVSKFNSAHLSVLFWFLTLGRSQHFSDLLCKASNIFCKVGAKTKLAPRIWNEVKMRCKVAVYTNLWRKRVHEYKEGSLTHCISRGKFALLFTETLTPVAYWCCKFLNPNFCLSFFLEAYVKKEFIWSHLFLIFCCTGYAKNLSSFARWEIFESWCR